MADYPVDERTWFEFLGHHSCCGLCGNSGVVDTRGKVETPSGEDCGVRAFCICPNGRTLKRHLHDELPPEGKELS